MLRNRHSWTGWIAALGLLLVLTTACTDGAELQKQMQQALSKHALSQQFAFDGKMELQLDYAPSAKEAPPLAHALFALIKESKLEWKGIASVDPLRMKTEMTLAPKGASSTHDMTFLIKDNKLYFRLPVLSMQGETYFADLDSLQQSSAPFLGMAPGIEPSGVTTAIAEALADGLEAKAFKKSSEDTTYTTIAADITSKNEQEANAAVQEMLKKGGANAPAIVAPGRIETKVDQEGNLLELVLDLTLSVTTEDGHTSKNRVLFQEAYDHSDQPVQDIVPPENARPWEDVLKRLGGVLSP